ncbi:hypothetical protein BH09PAT4_BH09PAT4_09020 [soil metagenome]
MSEQVESYTVVGRTVPYRPENEMVRMVEVSVHDGRLEVSLVEHPCGNFRCSSEIWQHTMYEMEMLSDTLRTAAAGPFPPPILTQGNAPETARYLGPASEEFGNFFPSICIEVCYSLESPGAQRAIFICRSKRTLLKWGGHYVSLGVALECAFAEVVLQPAEALAFADWLDRQIQEIKIEAGQEPLSG